MEIQKYRKIKNNMYEIHLDNGSILKLYDDCIIKFSLLLNKKINHKELIEITKYNEELEAYYLALRHLSKKMRSKLEVQKQLEKNEYNQKIIDDIISRLEKEGYLNSEKYIKSYINDQLNLTSNGPDKIKYNLIKFGFNEHEIVIEYDFSDKIKSLIDKKIKLNRKYNTSNLKINITQYLINLGYPKEMFMEYLNDIKVNDKSLIKKDYELLTKKYQRKYADKELKLFVRDKLYKKGYNIEEIREVMNNEL